MTSDTHPIPARTPATGVVPSADAAPWPTLRWVPVDRAWLLERSVTLEEVAAAGPDAEEDQRR